MRARKPILSLPAILLAMALAYVTSFGVGCGRGKSKKGTVPRGAKLVDLGPKQGIPRMLPIRTIGWLARTAGHYDTDGLGLPAAKVVNLIGRSETGMFAIVSGIDTGLDSRLCLVLWHPELSAAAEDLSFGLAVDGRKMPSVVLYTTSVSTPAYVSREVKDLDMTPPSEIKLLCLASRKGLGGCDSIVVTAHIRESGRELDRVDLINLRTSWGPGGAPRPWPVDPNRPWTKEGKEQVARSNVRDLTEDGAFETAERVIGYLGDSTLSPAFRMKLLEEVERTAVGRSIVSPFLREELLRQRPSAGDS